MAHKTQKERWVRDIKIVMRVGQQFVAKDICGRLQNYDWSSHQKKINRGARSRVLSPTTMQIVGVLKGHPDFQLIRVDRKTSCWKRVR